MVESNESKEEVTEVEDLKAAMEEKKREIFENQSILLQKSVNMLTPLLREKDFFKNMARRAVSRTQAQELLHCFCSVLILQELREIKELLKGREQPELVDMEEAQKGKPGAGIRLKKRKG